MVKQDTFSRLLRKRPQITPWTLVTMALVLVFLAPIFAVFVAASGDSGGLWAHLFTTVLPRYTANTLTLMFGVGVVSLVFGVSSAWMITRYEFPGRRVFEWLLLLPAAVPTYLIAYTYTDFLEYAGPVQQMLRELMGWKSARDYWFPEIRSMYGAMLVLGAVLYPYVYMMTRTSFLLTPSALFEVGQLAKRNVFFKVALPLSRPAIVAGLSLVLMETISEFGAVEYFAIETITLGIFNVWLGMNSLPAAAQIASISFLFIIALLSLELLARSKRRFHNTSKKSKGLLPVKASLGRAIGCITVCLIPVVVGFVVPVGVLLTFVLKGYSIDFEDTVITASMNSITLAGSVAIFIVTSAAFMGIVSNYQGGTFLKRMTALASIGYAFPGTILAIGVITVGGAVDNTIANFLENTFGISYQGWLTGSVGLVAIACTIRFQAVGYGAVNSGMERMPRYMMDASRVLGRTFMQSIAKVIMPLLKTSLLTGGLLVFVDVMKELPMTLLLRPFNYETLATFVYQYAKDELLEEAALPALFIVLMGIIPVMVMNATLRRMSK
ncbi:iron ABC transporter permease [Terasakiella sp. A23]|uniref:ABC transporter permease n=1 Tax=Terasakiella sp. FCG-A23 TaxID=3080561 RepID=UPI002955B7DD|nr:iron ABC transporter permease [Terasakiella sp. A23]MDV7341290.1 iron ABC transporter permease [Terasakiella sp. A23]